MVQALKALGCDHVDQKVIEQIHRQLEPKVRDRVLRDTCSVTGWVYEAIKEICKEVD